MLGSELWSGSASRASVSESSNIDDSLLINAHYICLVKIDFLFILCMNAYLGVWSPVLVCVRPDVMSGCLPQSLLHLIF